jgi:glycosyltransferase involved in cell wall biosynthesis
MPAAEAVIVIIPARDEAATVGKVVQDVRKFTGWEVIVIDDASLDNTAEKAQQSGARVVRLPFQLGAWGAIQTGMRYALKRGYRFGVTMDADGQHLATTLNNVTAPVLSGLSDVAIGICPRRVSGARRSAWAFFKWLTGLNLEDVTSGLRAYNEDAMELLTSKQATMLNYQDIGVLLMLRAEGMCVSESLVEMCARNSGHSRVYHSWWAVAGYLMETFILSTGHWRLSWHINNEFTASRNGSDDQ